MKSACISGIRNAYFCSAWVAIVWNERRQLKGLLNLC